MTKVKLLSLLLVVATFFTLADPAKAQGTVTGTDLKELGPLIARLINVLLGIVGAVSIILIIIGGMRMMMASGDEKATAAAKSTITFAIIGLVIVLLAVMLVNVLGYLLGAGDINFIRIGPAK